MGNFAENLNLGNRFRPPPWFCLESLYTDRDSSFVVVIAPSIGDFIDCDSL